MATKKLAGMIKDARTNAGLSQEKLASMVPGLTASEVSKAEHAEIDLSQEELKGIAKATGVTQKSLLEAAGYVKPAAKTTTTGKTSTAKTGTAAKTSTAKTSTAKTSTSKTSTAKTSTAKTSTSGTSEKLTATEKKLVDLYRAADSNTKKQVMAILKGETPEGGDILSTLIGSLMK
ncbi:MAG: helix-turn-helix transcriptional regulator [Clostridiales bacterium]|nr:helix-turn-helix transcriptional regulator [Candidatus Blautia equi]